MQGEAFSRSYRMHLAAVENRLRELVDAGLRPNVIRTQLRQHPLAADRLEFITSFDYSGEIASPYSEEL